MELYTIIAQIINFGVLILLLNKFLYKPVLKTMDKRRNDIKQKIEETEKKLQESDKLKEDYLKKLNEVEKENVVLRKQAVEDIKKFKELELQKVKEDISVKKDRFNDYLYSEQRSLIENFNDNLVDLFVKYSSDILKVIANSSLQKEVVNSFVDKLKNLAKDKVDAINNSNVDTIHILSSDELDDEEKKIIERSLTNKGINFEKIEYGIDKKLIVGVELRAKSYALSWNIKELTANFIANIGKKVIDKK